MRFAEIANQMADDVHGEVIGKAIASVTPRCDKCNYPQNHQAYESLLGAYKERKKRYHKLYKGLIPLPKILGIRRAMSEIEPCENCKLRYNPTGKASYKGLCLSRTPRKPANGLINE